MTPVGLPLLSISNRQRGIRLDLTTIRSTVSSALPDCLAVTGPDHPPVLPGLDEVTVAIVSARTMAIMHRDFLGIDGPTDVITFPYGEIIVCADVAADYGIDYGTSAGDEVTLYIIHGLLHLNGFDDVTASSARRMRTRQTKILARAQCRA